MKLTKRNIDSLPLPETGQVLYWDDELPGYGLRATKGAKTITYKLSHLVDCQGGNWRCWRTFTRRFFAGSFDNA